MAVAAIVPIATFSRGLLQGILDGIGEVDRKVVVGFKNNTDYKLQSLGVHHESGTSDQNVPYEIPKRTALMFPAHKTKGPVARGTVGVLSFYNQDLDKTAHVMWSVPFDYNLYSNWWNAVVIDGRRDPNKQVYSHLYNGTGGCPYPQKPDQWADYAINDGFQLLGSMTNNGQALLEVELKLKA